MGAPSKPIIEFQDVSKSYLGVKAVSHLSFSLYSGEVLCLLGENGAGKSTVIKILTGVERPSLGQVLFNGAVTHFDSPRAAREVGVATVYQEVGTLPLMSVARNFVLAAEPTKGRGIFRRLDIESASATALARLRELGISRVTDGNQLVGTLSGGERQALAIARALHFGARVLVLDEPTAALGVRESATVLRLIEPTSGEIIFNGTNLTHLDNTKMRELRKDLQIIFQDPYSSLNPRITIGQAIMEPMQVHNILESDKARKERVIELLHRVNMNESHFYRYPHEFSGGQRQRICIARAIALKPKFIICDESVSALDVSVQAQVLNLLNELKREFDFTYIFISHDLSVVKFMSDRMVVMNKGKVEEMGDADEIYSNPQTEYTKNLINAIPKGQLEDIKASISRKKSIQESGQTVFK